MVLIMLVINLFSLLTCYTPGVFLGSKWDLKRRMERLLEIWRAYLVQKLNSWMMKKKGWRRRQGERLLR
ncbi:hypothetical protein IMY05_010G0065900 [Salix suchowensis]|nr:hypothetical protein IMY05_010G0065900 [Salix suchowensis]